MLNIQVNGLQPIAQMQLWIIVQAGALKPPVPVCYCPTNQITENVMIEMEFKRNAIVEAQIFGKHGVALHQALTESHRLCAASPDEESHLVGHCGSKSTEILLGQLFKMQLGTFIDLKVKRIYFIDDRCHVIGY